MAPTTLPLKEQKLVRELSTEYENRQYKKVIKISDQILKKYPEHGETLCLRGISIFQMGRKAEGAELVNKGLRCDIMSSVCWHVQGLLHRDEKNYAEALKCLMQAHRIDKENPNLIREITFLQFRLRKFVESIPFRVLLLRYYPRTRAYWAGLIMTYALADLPDKALYALEKFEGSFEGQKRGDTDLNEIILFHAQLLREVGKFEESLQYLEEKKEYIVERRGLENARVQALLGLDRKKDALEILRQKLEDNSDSYSNIEEYLIAQDININGKGEEDSEKALQALEDLSKDFPESYSIVRLALTVANGDAFKTRAEKYILKGIQRGIPSLFNDIKALYESPVKCEIVERIVESYYNNLQQSGRMSLNNGSDKATIDPTTSLLWTQYFLAQHYSKRGRNVKALEMIDTAIKHTPSLPDLYLFKARILKRGGASQAAEKAMSQARDLDYQDRYLNSKHAKYLMRAGKPEEAGEIAGLFTRKEASTPLSDLMDIECLWYVMEQGEAYRKRNNRQMALKRFHQVHTVTSSMSSAEDIFQWAYARPMTLRTFKQMPEAQDRFWLLPEFIRAMRGAVDIYLELEDEKTNNRQGTIVNGASDSANGDADEERRKAEKKAKKAQAKAAAQQQQSKKTEKSTKVADESTQNKDEDADGAFLYAKAVSEPLEEAVKLVRVLEEYSQSVIDTWLISFDVAIRRKKYVQAIKALRRGYNLSPTNVDILERVAIFFLPEHVENWPKDSTEFQVLEEQGRALLGEAVSKDEALGNLAKVLTRELIQRHGNSGQHILAAARMQYRIGEVEEATNLFMGLLRDEVLCDLLTILNALEFMKKVQSPNVDAFKKGALNLHPIAETLQ